MPNKFQNHLFFQVFSRYPFRGYHCRLSLTHQLRLSLGLIGCFSALATGGILIYISWYSYLMASQQLQQQRAQAATSQITNYLDDLYRKLGYLARVPGLAELSPGIQHRFLEGLTRHNDAYEAVALLDRKGQVMVSVTPYGPLGSQNFANTPLFKRAFQQHEDYVSPVTLHPQTGIPITTLAMPVRNQKDEVAGVLMATINLKFLEFVITQNRVGKTGYIYIVDERNVVIASTSHSWDSTLLTPLSSSPLVQQITASETNQQLNIYRGLEGVNVLGISHYIEAVSWHLVVELPISEAYDPLRQMLGVMGGILILIGGAAVALGLILSRQIVLPLEDLTKAAAAIREGKLETMVKIHNTPELALLATTFNEMATQLTSLFAAVEVERNVAQEALYHFRKAQTQLVQSEKMSSLGQLVAGVAHEINNPVNFIYGNLIHTEAYTSSLIKILQLYQQFYPNPPSEILNLSDEIDVDFLIEDLPQILTSMKIGSNRIREIVLSLRNFSRLDEAEMKEVDIHEGLDNTLLILRNRLQTISNSTEIQVIKNYGELPLVECYPGQLNQVFMNIISNAIDALNEYYNGYDLAKIQDNKPQITIQTMLCEEQVQIKITDNGAGISQSIQSKLFDPFFTTKPIGKGTGLGLSISYQIIVEKHRGSLEFMPQVGQGATFVIKIPVHQTSKNIS